MAMTWQSTCHTARQARDATLSRVVPPLPPIPAPLPDNVTALPSTLLTSDENAITKSSPEVLLRKLADSELSAVTVVNAFLRRACIAQHLTNCVTELLPDSALTRAQFLDDYLARNGKPIGPLHGLPISVKEHIGIKGLNLDGAVVSGYGNIAPGNALILKALWLAGAVFHARTTQPQTIMHLETSSNLYGVTVNPYNRSLTAGGSSGGEGALLGLRGSCLGIGTDIGGSIRSPAANNGLYGLRPSTFRLPYTGIGGPGAGMEQILGVVGPLSTSLRGIDIFMKAIIDMKPWLHDPSLVPLPWSSTGNLRIDERTETSRIKVGVLWDDGVVKPHPPILRALRETVQKWKSIPGVEVVDWTPLKHDEAWEIIAGLYFPDGGADEALSIDSSGEPWLPLSNWIIKENPHVRPMTVHEIWHATSRRDAYRSEYASHWNSTATEHDPATKTPLDAVDVILCPAGPGVAPPLGCAKYWGYTSQWNLLDYPALVFPVGFVDVDKDEVGEYGGHVPRNEDDRFNKELYTSAGRYKDAPISLQLVGRRFEDGKVVEVLRYLSEAVRG